MKRNRKKASEGSVARPKAPPLVAAEPRRAAGWRRRAVVMLLPTAIYLAGALLLGDWLIDDAGISYAYAKNLAAGDGFVSHPGRVPVEGYSNFLWVVLLVPFHVVGIFHPVWTAKILSIALVLSAFVLIQRTLERHLARWEPGFFATLWIASAPPIVIWTVSGLENGLMLLLVVALWARAVERGRSWRFHCGLLAALAAMTHPEGIVYSGFAALASIQDEPDRSRGRLKQAALGLARCAGGFLLLFAPFFALRLIVFGKPWPQPYYAKRTYASFAEQLGDFAHHPGTLLDRVLEIGRVFAGAPGPWLLAILVAAVIALWVTGRLQRPIALAACLLAFAVAGFILIGPDWMGEYRFATGAIAGFAITLGGVLFASASAASSPARVRSRTVIGRVVGAVSSVVILWGAVPRVGAFARNPPTPYLDAERRVAERFAVYGRMLGVPKPSILVEDIGAVLYSGQLVVYDVAGLIEPDATATLKIDRVRWRPDHPEFHDWAFETIRPTFITTRGFWSLIPAFEFDPRFIRDYAPIHAYVDPYVLDRNQLVLHSGDFVRRDAMRSPADLERLRSSDGAAPLPSTPAWRLTDAWRRLRRGVPSRESVREEAIRVEASGRDPNRAAVLYRRVLDREPNDERALLGLARSLDRTGRTSEARPVWLRLRERVQAAGTASDPQLLLSILERLDDPRHRLPVTTVAQNQWMRNGVRALEHQGRADAAIDLFRDVLTVNPKHDGALVMLARALTVAGQRVEAEGAWAAVLTRAAERGDQALVEEAGAALRQIASGSFGAAGAARDRAKRR